MDTLLLSLKATYMWISKDFLERSMHVCVCVGGGGVDRGYVDVGGGVWTGLIVETASFNM